MHTCKEVATLLSKDVDGELSALERTKLQAHLVICDTCRQVVHQFQLMNSAAGWHDGSSLRGLSEDSKTRLKKSLRRAIDESEND